MLLHRFANVRSRGCALVYLRGRAVVLSHYYAVVLLGNCAAVWLCNRMCKYCPVVRLCGCVIVVGLVTPIIRTTMQLCSCAVWQVCGCLVARLRGRAGCNPLFGVLHSRTTERSHGSATLQPCGCAVAVLHKCTILIVLNDTGDLPGPCNRVVMVVSIVVAMAKV